MSKRFYSEVEMRIDNNTNNVSFNAMRIRYMPDTPTAKRVEELIELYKAHKLEAAVPRPKLPENLVGLQGKVQTENIESDVVLFFDSKKTQAGFNSEMANLNVNRLNIANGFKNSPKVVKDAILSCLMSITNFGFFRT